MSGAQELWGLLASASQNPSGVPQRLLDEKAEELRKKKETQDRINVRSVPVIGSTCLIRIHMLRIGPADGLPCAGMSTYTMLAPGLPAALQP